MGKFIDLTGQKFNRLTVLEKLNKQGNEWIWKCKCDCGTICNVKGVNIRTGRTKSCGCWKQESDKSPKGNVKDEIGKIYGHLKVIARKGSDFAGHALWECECDCLSHSHIIVTGDNLRRGHTQSCGCERRSKGELAVEKVLIENNISYIQEYSAFKFANGKNAKFDFYINNQYFIEYDGETHYTSNLHGWHNEIQLKAQQERDIIKNQWCIDNNIPLIRIPYTHLDKLCLEDLLLETSKFIINENNQ